MAKPPEPPASDRVAQLEEALAISRELYRDVQRRHERHERLWGEREVKLLQRIEWLEATIAGDVMRASKAKKPRKRK